MRKTSLVLLLTLLASSLTLTPLVFKAKAAVTPTIYLEPSDNTFYTDTTNVGHLFNVTFWCANVTQDLGGAQIRLYFNDSIINVTRWFTVPESEGGFMPEPITALPNPPNPGYVHTGPGQAYIQIAVSKGGLPPTAPWGHNGTIAIVEFNITMAPPEGGQLSCILDINNTSTYLLDTNASPISGVTKENGSYTFISIPTGSIWLEASPATFETRKPRPFNVSILIENVSQSLGLIGVQFIVTYNSTYLEVEQIIQGDFLRNSTWAPYGTAKSAYVDDRGVIYGEFILPNSTGYYNPPFPEGNGTVATITFLPILHENVNFNISVTPLFDEFFLDKNGEWLPYLPPKNCDYTYNPLPVPTLAVTPSEYIASSVGETFDINLTLNNLDAQWNLTYAEFTLEYDNSSLQLLNVAEGDFLSQFGDTTFNHTETDGKIEMNVTLTPTTYPFGSGTLATIRFNVTKCPGFSTLTLNNTQLLDFELKDILHEIQQGSYVLHEKLVHPITLDTETYYVVTVSNCCISPVPMLFDPAHMMLSFNVTGINNTIGFVNVTIPRALLYASPTDWLVIVGGKEVAATVVENGTHASIYFTFNLSSKTVYILGTSAIPEITPNVAMLVSLLATIAVLAIAKTKLKKHEKLTYCKKG